MTPFLIFLDSGSPPAFAGVDRNDVRKYSANFRATTLVVKALQGEPLKAATDLLSSLAAAFHVFGITKTWKLRVGA